MVSKILLTIVLLVFVYGLWLSLKDKTVTKRFPPNYFRKKEIARIKQKIYYLNGVKRVLEKATDDDRSILDLKEVNKKLVVYKQMIEELEREDF